MLTYLFLIGFFVYRVFLICVFLTSSLLGAYYLVPQICENRELDLRLEDYSSQVRIDEKEIGRRRAMIEGLNNDKDTVARVAREKFGLCRPGERVYKFIDEDLLEDTK